MKTADNPTAENTGLRIIRMREVCRKTTFSQAHIFNLINDGKFPKSFHLTPGSRAVGWLETTVDDWIMKQAGVA